MITQNKIAKPNILVTGGTGYIGSHACLELLLARHQITVLDNLSMVTQLQNK